jgi:hypothetical protein
MKLLLLLGGFPQAHKMIIFAFPVFPHHEDDALEAFFHPGQGLGTVPEHPSAGRGNNGAKRFPVPPQS